MLTRTVGLCCIGLLLGAHGALAQVEAEPAGDAPAAADPLAGARVRGILDAPVRLVDGAFEGAPAEPGAASRARIELVPDFRLRGDLDGDGADEDAALLDASFGGSGSFVYVAVFDRARGEADAALVGDRVQVRSGRIADGAVVLEVVQAGPGDAACCPSQKATRRFRIERGRLVEAEAVFSGTLAPADLAGVSWRLLRLAQDEPVPDDAGITLTIADDAASGSGGCNRYRTGVLADAGGELAFGPIAGTRRACGADVMAREDRYFEALGATTGFGFLAGRLALSWRDGDTLHTMLFAPADAPP